MRLGIVEKKDSGFDHTLEDYEGFKDEKNERNKFESKICCRSDCNMCAAMFSVLL